MPKKLDLLDEPTRDLVHTAMDWMDARWNEDLGLLAYAPDPAHPGPAHGVRTVRHGVRDSVWYALGLLLRDRPGDAARACRALSAILDNQWNTPGRIYHGTFRRAPEEGDPPAEPVRWQHYDPNWRQFIGTILAIIIEDYAPALPPALLSRLDHAIRLAIVGEEAEGRLTERYTNISLMRAPLEVWAGTRYGEDEWLRRGEAWAEAIYRNFCEFQAFDEYNSPTYYGPDLFALGFWCEYAPSATLRRYAEEMEAALWRDVARFYHAGLRNICGPYARSYGMDMTRYVAILGQAIWMAVGGALAPHPQPSPAMEHPNDLMFPPALAAVGVRVPADALPALRAFPGEHTVQRPLMGRPFVEASAWLGEECMIGAAVTDLSRPAGGQMHPATMHWRLPDGSIGWLRLVEGERVEARAAARTLTISCAGNAAFQVHAPGAGLGAARRDAWHLPGLTVRVEASAAGFAVVPSDEGLTISYRDAARLVLTV
ncbi:MAG: hypothetical protein GX657_02970 [Chloroflexi bacterium]|nr:hypothetical protein [Chloroflexota bacterium]